MGAKSISEREELLVCKQYPVSYTHLDVYKRQAFYRDEEYVYVYMPSNYYYLYCKLDFLFVGNLILEEQSGLEVSTLTKIPLIE